MQKQAKKLVVGLGAAYAIKCGTQSLMGSLCARSPHSIVVEYPEVVKRYPSLSLEVSQLANLEQEGRFRSIMELLKEMVFLDRERRRGNEFKMARLWSTLQASFHHIVEDTRGWESDRLFNEKRIAVEDTIPTLDRQLENIVHNYIIRLSE